MRYDYQCRACGLVVEHEHTITDGAPPLELHDREHAPHAWRPVDHPASICVSHTFHRVWEAPHLNLGPSEAKHGDDFAGYTKRRMTQA